jgi:hypothetical protein
MTCLYWWPRRYLTVIPLRNNVVHRRNYRGIIQQFSSQLSDRFMKRLFTAMSPGVVQGIASAMALEVSGGSPSYYVECDFSQPLRSLPEIRRVIL